MYGTRRSTTPVQQLRQKKNLSMYSDGFSDKEIDIKDKDEEAKEIAGYLSMIRKRHDKIKEENLKKKAILERLKKGYEKSTEMAKTSEETNESIEVRIEKVKDLLENTRKQHKEEMKDYKSYIHILDRMKEDKISMELQANSIQISLKSTKHVLGSETRKSQRIREAHYHSKMILQNLKKTFSQRRRKKDEYLNNLERELKFREDVAERREDRQKRQIEIAEAAANDDKDSPEVKLREALLLFKLWYNFLNKKLSCEMQNAVDVEKAFSKIKAATGLMDVNEIVEKFLTREQNYLVLINAVNEAESKLKFLRVENNSAKEMLNALQFEESRGRPESPQKAVEIEKKLSRGHKNYFDIKEKLKNSIKTYDQILN